MRVRLGRAEPEKLIQAATNEGVTISMVLTTHKHWCGPARVGAEGRGRWRVSYLEHTALLGTKKTAQPDPVEAQRRRALPLRACSALAAPPVRLAARGTPYVVGV